MTMGFAKRSTLGILALCASGCELLPGLFSNLGGPPDPMAAALVVTIDHVEGTIDGMTLDPNLLEASGLRSGPSLQLDVHSPHENAVLSVFTSTVESSSQNPYGTIGVGGRERPLPDADVEDFDPNRAFILACSADVCREAADFGLEIEQLPDGRSVVLDGTWSEGDRLHLELHYEEQL
jgi:hypothetical protein